MLNPIDEAPTGPKGSPILKSLLQVAKGERVKQEQEDNIVKEGPSCWDAESGVNLVAEQQLYEECKARRYGPGWTGHDLSDQDKTYIRALDQLTGLYRNATLYGYNAYNKDAIARRLVGLCNIHGLDVCRRVNDSLSGLLDKYTPCPIQPTLQQNDRDQD